MLQEVRRLRAAWDSGGWQGGMRWALRSLPTQRFRVFVVCCVCQESKPQWFCDTV